MTPTATAINAPHIVIIGAAYAGLSALNSLISLSAGKEPPEDKRKGGPPRNGGHAEKGPPRNDGPRGSHNGAPPRALKKKPRYTVLDQRDGFYHTVGAPLGQISASFAREFWVKFDEIFATKRDEDIDFIQGSAIDIGLESKTLTFTQAQSPTETKKLSYDFLIVASGLSRKWPVVPKSFDFDSYIMDVENWEADLSQCNKIAVVGGGACGIEMAAELKMHFPSKEIILLHSRNKLLSNEPLAEDFKFMALRLLREQGVQVRLNTRLEKDTPHPSGPSRTLTLSTGDVLDYDKVIYSAAQQGANTTFVPEHLREPKHGCINVRDTFQFPLESLNADVHYAVGDAAEWPMSIKRCGPAQSQGRFAAANIIAMLIALEDGKAASDAVLQHYPPNKPSMTLAIGEQAVSMRNGLSYGKGVKMGAFGTGLGIDGSLASLGIRPRRQ